MNNKLLTTIALSVTSVFVAFNMTNLGYVANPAYAGLSNNYQQLSASEKRDQLWNKALADNNTPGRFPNPLDLIRLVDPVALGGQEFTVVGANDSDINQDEKRRKFIHSVGSHAKVKLLWEPNNGYTGTFENTNGSHAIVRASSAKEATKNKSQPGFGLKVFKDGTASANLVAMWSLYGQDSVNYFENNFSNHVSSLPNWSINPEVVPLKVLAAKFSAYDPNPNMVGLTEFSMTRDDGTTVDHPKTPFSLVFHPNPSLTEMCKNVPLTPKKLFGCFDQIAEGTVLYHIYAADRPIPKSDASNPDSLK